MLLLLALALVGPALVPHDPLATDVTRALAPPGATHWFGTDQLGRDVFARVVTAARLDLLVAFGAVGLSFAIGAPIGTAMGYAGGAFDHALSRATEVLMAFPLFALAMGVVAAAGNSVGAVLAATALVNLPFYIRLARTEARARRRLAYVEASRLNGASHARIVVAVLLPNALPVLLAQASVNMGWAMLNMAGLGFLGLGVRAPTPEWGMMVAEGARFLQTGQWWLVAAPGGALFAAVLVFQLLGDALGDKTREA